MESPEYREGSASTVTDNGREYRVDDLLDATRGIPTVPCRVDKLEWILKYTNVDPDRVDRADCRYPIIYTIRDGKYILLDGAHRLTKAIRNGLRTIPSKFIDSNGLTI